MTFLVCSSGMEGTSWAGASICGFTLKEEEMCPLHVLFPVSSTYSQTQVGPRLLGRLTWPHLKAVLPTSCLYCASLVLLDIGTPSISVFSPSVNAVFLEDKLDLRYLSPQDLASTL